MHWNSVSKQGVPKEGTTRTTGCPGGSRKREKRKERRMHFPHHSRPAASPVRAKSSSPRRVSHLREGQAARRRSHAPDLSASRRRRGSPVRKPPPPISRPSLKKGEASTRRPPAAPPRKERRRRTGSSARRKTSPKPRSRSSKSRGTPALHSSPPVPWLSLPSFQAESSGTSGRSARLFSPKNSRKKGVVP